MENFKLNLKFKGDRDYLHGTDIYASVIAHIEKYCEVSSIDLTFHSVARKALEGRFSTDPSGGDIDFVALFKIASLDKGEFNVRLYETQALPNGRVPYDEEVIVDAAEYDLGMKKVKLRGFYAYTTLEKVVALNKALLSKIFLDDGKWYFTRLVVTTEINSKEPGVIELRLSKNIGSKITKSIIELDGIECGAIFFAKVKDAM